jgi:prevent-host-death family protein
MRLVVTFLQSDVLLQNTSNAMAITTLSSREFNQDTSRAKKAAADGPVFITDRGKPAHVLLSIEEYRRITGQRRNIADFLAMPGLSDIELELPPRTERAKPVDLP